MSLIFSAIATFIAVAWAGAAPAGHEYIAPGPGDVRSPCPGINSLANHGYFPRNGKGIDLATATKGLKEGLNVGADFALAVGGLALLSTPGLAPSTFDLNFLDQHNFPIEHDASLSRNDAYFGNDYSFNQGIFDEVLDYYDGATIATIPAASLARYHRVTAQRASNPTFIYGPRQLVLSYGETALYLSTMGNPITADAPVAYIKTFFENERLPYELGWSPPVLETNLVTLGAMVSQLQLANPEALPEGLTLGEGALRDVYQLRDPITGLIVNATQAAHGL